MRQMVDLFRSNPEHVQSLYNAMKADPAIVSVLPDGALHLKDGHHRAFLLAQAGETDIPCAQKDGDLS